MSINELQQKIIILLVDGKTNQQIADELCFSVDKIKKELKKIYKSFRITAPAEVKRAVLVREIVRTEMSKLML